MSHTDNWTCGGPVKQGDRIAARVEVVGSEKDEPLTTLDCLDTNKDDVVVLDGTALVWTEPLA